MKKIIIIVFPIILVGGFLLYKTLQTPNMPTHYHANFAVFVADTQINFSQPDFMSLKPCTPNQEPSENRLDNVHLHDNVGNVVHLHQDGITWRDLFTSLRFDIQKQIDDNREKNLTVKYYINGELSDQNTLDRVINKNEQLLVSINALPEINNVNESEILTTQVAKVGNNAHEYDEKKGTESCSGTEPYTFTQRFKIMLKNLL